MNEFTDVKQTASLRNSIEVTKLQEDISLLRRTKGYRQLSKLQQRMIALSLYISARAVRTSDPVSAKAIVYPPDKSSYGIRIEYEFLQRRKGIDPKERKYKLSQSNIISWNCEDAVAALEAESTVQPDIEPSFSETEYEKINETEIVNRVKEIGFPAAIHIKHKTRHLHSFIVLGPVDGHDEKHQKDLIVWEKEGTGFLYRLNTLHKVFLEYGNEYETQLSWGIRPLRKPGSTK